MQYWLGKAVDMPAPGFTRLSARRSPTSVSGNVLGFRLAASPQALRQCRIRHIIIHEFRRQATGLTPWRDQEPSPIGVGTGGGRGVASSIAGRRGPEPSPLKTDAGDRDTLSRAPDPGREPDLAHHVPGGLGCGIDLGGRQQEDPADAPKCHCGMQAAAESVR